MFQFFVGCMAFVTLYAFLVAVLFLGSWLNDRAAGV